MNADEFRDLVNTRAVDHSSVNPDLMGSANTDWQNEIFKTAIGQDYNLGLSGSAATIPFRASVGYTNQDGILKTSNLERYTGSLNVNPDFLESHLKLSLGVKAMKINNRFADKGAIGNALRFDPTQPVKDDDPKYDRYGGYYTWLMSDGTRNVNGTRNPVAQLMQRADKSVITSYSIHYTKLYDIQTDTETYPIGGIQDLSKVFRRITSYNVCYTKLLRIPLAEKHLVAL